MFKYYIYHINNFSLVSMVEHQPKEGFDTTVAAEKYIIKNYSNNNKYLILKTYSNKMKYENEVLYYHSEYQGHKKSRYTVAGMFTKENELILAYSRRNPEDNFSKKVGRELAQFRLTNMESNYIKIIPQIKEVSRKVFITEARNFIKK